MQHLFTRQETLKLSRLSEGKIAYLDDIKLVCPLKIGNPVRPKSLYNWLQIIELRTIHRLRENSSLQQLRQAKDYLAQIGDTQGLADKRLVATDNKIYLIKNKPGELECLIIQLSGKNQGQLIINSTFLIQDIVADLWLTAEQEKIKNFAARAGNRNYNDVEKVA